MDLSIMRIEQTTDEYQIEKQFRNIVEEPEKDVIEPSACGVHTRPLGTNRKHGKG